MRLTTSGPSPLPRPMTAHSPDPKDAVPDEITMGLEDCSDRQLRATIEYAQRLLQDHPELTEAIESRPGERLVRTEDHGTYTIAIVERPDETGDQRGPFAYLVNWEPGLPGEEGQYRWQYLGMVHAGSGES